MIKYPLAYNPILDYWQKIERGEIVVPHKVKVEYRYLVKLIEDDSQSEYEYRASRANHAIEFIENYCKHSKGKWGGKPIELELWQKAFLAGLFGFIHKIDDTRMHREGFLVVGRKNGKSTMASGTGNYGQIADGEPGAEVYAVATKKDQAKLVWSEAKRMVNKSPALRKRIKTLVAEMRCEMNDSSFTFLGSDSDKLDGLNVHFALLDEIHAWKDKNLYDVIVDGTSARDQPVILMISTAGTIRESVYDLKYNEAVAHINDIEESGKPKDISFFPVIYELDHRKEWVDEKCWVKANPGLGTIKKTDELRRKVEKAKNNPLLVKNLLTKDFNIRETSSEAWLTFEQLNNTTTFNLKDLKPRYGIGGADLSATTDLTAAKVLFMLPDDSNVYVVSMYWLPEDLLEQRSKEDKIPYDLWYEQGLLRTTPGNSVHAKYVTEWFIEVQNELDIYIPWIGYDSWSAKYWVEEMQGNFGDESMIPIPQTRKFLSGHMKLMGAELDAKRIIYNNNPIDKWCLSNTAVEADKSGNIQPCKTSNQRRRIDGTAALLNAFAVLQDKKQEYLTMI
jgi:phage terminase large subunit-like protein